MKELKKIDFEKNLIEGKSGKIYKVSSSLSVGRFPHWQRFQNEIAFGASFESIFANLKTAWEQLNKQKLGDAAVVLHNTMNGINSALQKRHHAVMYGCSLFINSEDEDLDVWSEETAKLKIDDWSEYDSSDFFSLAFNLVPDFIRVYKETTLNTSEAATTEKKDPNTSDS